MICMKLFFAFLIAFIAEVHFLKLTLPGFFFLVSHMTSIFGGKGNGNNVPVK